MKTYVFFVDRGVSTKNALSLQYKNEAVLV